jgi:pimeloyl-ACP methyl ester carboxylesterase
VYSANIYTQGPIAVPASKLPKNLRVTTHVNGEERQNATIEDLIFSVPFLIKTISEGQTLQAGDVIATGTPAGVGIGKTPPVFLKPGDRVDVSVTGLGTLSNKIGDVSMLNSTVSRVSAETHLLTSNLIKSCGGVGLTTVGSKSLHYRKLGSGSPIIFIHGLGGSSEFYTPLITALSLERSHTLHLLDIEGHGLSPTSALSSVSISSYANDFHALADQEGIQGATVIAHSMGCLVAMTLATKFPELVSKLILLGPPPSPVPEAGRNGSIARATVVRQSGMAAVVDAIISAGTSAKSKNESPIAIAAIRLSLLGQDPEGYAKGCTALGGATEGIPIDQIRAQTLIVTGEEDKVSPPQVCENYAKHIKWSQVEVLPQVGHWHVFEDLQGVAGTVGSFLNKNFSR